MAHSLCRTAVLLCMLLVHAHERQVMAAQVGEASHLHVILAMDTDAAGISSAIAADLRLLTQVLGEIRDGREGKVTVTVLKGAQVSPEGIVARLRSLAHDDGRSLLLIYSGHGGLDRVRGHFLATRRGKLYRSTLRAAMDDTGSGLKVLLTNCCSNIAGVDPPNRRIPANWEAFHQLFFQHRGFVDITAASEGTLGWASMTHGGYFTRCLAKLLCDPISSTDDGGDGFVTWNEVSARLRRDTNALFLKARDAAGPSPGNPNHISHFESQLPQTYCVGYADWELASLHHHLRASLWEEQGVRFALATYRELDPARARLRTAAGNRAVAIRAAMLSASAAGCYNNAARSAEQAARYAQIHRTQHEASDLTRRMQKYDRTAAAYAQLAKRGSR